MNQPASGQQQLVGLEAGSSAAQKPAPVATAKGTTGVMYSAAAPGVLRQRVPVWSLLHCI